MVGWIYIWWLWWMWENKIMDYIRIYYLAIKYWFQGDDWKGAVSYATLIVKGWNNNG